MNLHPARPTVYLDQWVWIRLAAAAAGRPREPGDTAVLDAVRDASSAGVAFPLSGTHYVETGAIRDPRQRRDLASIVGEIGHFRTLRCRAELLDHQFRGALHEWAGRPTFRPVAPEVLGTGIHWAFTGRLAPLTIKGADQAALREAERLFPRAYRCRLTQQAEIELLAGPADDEIQLLRDEYGYRPEEILDVTRARLKFETDYVSILADDRISSAELRFRVRLREVLHEHLDRLLGLFHEYRLSLRLIGARDADPQTSDVKANRERMDQFVDLIPSLRLAAHMKTALLRNPQTQWATNHIHDIDALSLAIPYCHIVVSDKAAANWISRAEMRHHNTTVISRLSDLPDHLPRLARRASGLGDPTGWDWCEEGLGWYPLPLDQAVAEAKGSRPRRTT